MAPPPSLSTCVVSPRPLWPGGGGGLGGAPRTVGAAEPSLPTSGLGSLLLSCISVVHFTALLREGRRTGAGCTGLRPGLRCFSARERQGDPGCLCTHWGSLERQSRSVPWSLKSLLSFALDASVRPVPCPWPLPPVVRGAQSLWLLACSLSLPAGAGAASLAHSNRPPCCPHCRRLRGLCQPLGRL